MRHSIFSLPKLWSWWEVHGAEHGLLRVKLKVTSALAYDSASANSVVYWQP